MTGTTLHTVSRILSAWEQLGLVKGGRQKLLIRDRPDCRPWPTIWECNTGRQDHTEVRYC